jgi:hypothetical protein
MKWWADALDLRRKPGGTACFASSEPGTQPHPGFRAHPRHDLRRDDTDAAFAAGSEKPFEDKRRTMIAATETMRAQDLP